MRKVFALLEVGAVLVLTFGTFLSKLLVTEIPNINHRSDLIFAEGSRSMPFLPIVSEIVMIVVCGFMIHAVFPELRSHAAKLHNSIRRVSAFVFKILIVFALIAGLFMFLESNIMKPLTGMSYAGPVELKLVTSYMTFYTVIYMFITFLFFYGHEIYWSALRWASMRQVGIAFLCSIFAFGITYAALSFSEGMYQSIREIAVHTALPLRLLLGGVQYSIILAACVPLLALVYPWEAIKKYWWPLFFGACILVAFPLAMTIETAYHSVVAQPFLYAVYYLLSILNLHVWIDLSTTEIVVEQYLANVGPACIGVGYHFILWTYILYLLARLRHSCTIHWKRVVPSLLFGSAAFQIINTLRIAALSIAVITYDSYEYALIHGILGSVLFCGFFYFFIKRTLQWCIAKPL